jgi:hypothetical protein
MRSLARLTLALLLALTGALAACGDDGGGTDVGLEDREGEERDDPSEDEGQDDQEDEGDEPESDDDPDDGDEGDEPSADEGPFVDALAETFTSDPTTPMSDDEARCAAARIVGVIGLDRLEDAGFTPESFAGEDSELTTLGLSTDEGLEIIDAFDSCGFDFYEEIIAAFIADATDPDAARACMEAVATPDEFRLFMARGFVEPGFEDSAEADAFFEEFFGCAFSGLGDLDG